MKKSEMIGHVQAELLEAINVYLIASVGSKPYVLKARADGLLAMIEGFLEDLPVVQDTRLSGEILPNGDERVIRRSYIGWDREE